MDYDSVWDGRSVGPISHVLYQCPDPPIGRGNFGMDIRWSIVMYRENVVWQLPIIEHKTDRHGGHSWEQQCLFDNPHDDDDDF